MSNTASMFTLMASSALSEFRAARLLKRIREVAPAAQGVSARFVHFVHAQKALTEDESARLQALLHYGFDSEDVKADATFMVIHAWVRSVPGLVKLPISPTIAV